MKKLENVEKKRVEKSSIFVEIKNVLCMVHKKAAVIIVKMIKLQKLQKNY